MARLVFLRIRRLAEACDVSYPYYNVVASKLASCSGESLYLPGRAGGQLWGGLKARRDTYADFSGGDLTRAPAGILTYLEQRYDRDRAEHYDG